MAAPEPRKTIRIGVFIPTNTQLLDAACIDILASMSHEYLSLIKHIPAPILNLAPSVQISYISTIPAGHPIPFTASMSVLCTHHLSDPAVQPGQLDAVLVPGPDPQTDWADKEEATDWLAAHAASKGTDILCVCTGIYLCGAAGLLKGKKACGPRGLQGDLERRFEGVEWVGEEMRWVRDGAFWSSGGVTNGNDMVAAYARLSGRFPGPVAEFGLMLTDTGDRPQRYETGKTVMTLGILWQIVKAVFMGIGKKKVV